jgi:hypothetical protein
MTTIVAVVLVQLVLLALIVLYFVAARLAEAREPDVRLAELRGFTRGGKASVALLEPVGILTAALPLGLLDRLAGRRCSGPQSSSTGSLLAWTCWPSWRRS